MDLRPDNMTAIQKIEHESLLEQRAALERRYQKVECVQEATKHLASLRHADASVLREAESLVGMPGLVLGRLVELEELAAKVDVMLNETEEAIDRIEDRIEELESAK